jgi:hypothetical protein
VAKRLDSILERFPVVSSRQPVLFSSVPVPAAATRRREGCGGAAEGLRKCELRRGGSATEFLPPRPDGTWKLALSNSDLKRRDLKRRKMM